MRILFISRWFPYPPNNGSKLRIINLLRGLSNFHIVDLLSFTDRVVSESDLLILHNYCQSIKTEPWITYNPHSPQARFGYLRLVPRSLIDTYSHSMARGIMEMLEKHSYDLVIASQLDTAIYRRHFIGVPALFEEVEVGVLYMRYLLAKTQKQKLRSWLTWEKHKHFLKHLLREFQNCSVVSAQERNLILKEISTDVNIDIIPNGVMLSEYDKIEIPPQSNTIIFTGPFTYYVNYEAMCWFVENVYPRIQEKIPDVKLIITGDSAGLKLPNKKNVVHLGYVEDVRVHIASSWVSVAPLLQGGGTRLKIIESMALHTPVISTTIGADGLGACPGKDLIIADTPDDFASAVVQVLINERLRKEISINAYQFVRENLDWSVIMPSFLDLVEKTAYSRT